MTQITFELGDHPQKTGVYVNPDCRWSLKEIANEIIKLGEENFVKQYCYYEKRSKEPSTTNAFDKYQKEKTRNVFNGSVKLKDNTQIITNTTNRKTKYDISVNGKILFAGANKVQMVYNVLSYLIETEKYSPEDLNSQYKNRYFKYSLLKSFPRNFDSDQIKANLGKDSNRFGHKYLLNSNGLAWCPCSQWTPSNTNKFINDMLKFNDVIENTISITEI